MWGVWYSLSPRRREVLARMKRSAPRMRECAMRLFLPAAAAALLGCSNQPAPQTYQPTGIPNQCDGGCSSSEVCRLFVYGGNTNCPAIGPYSPQVCPDAGDACLCVAQASCQAFPQCDPLDCDCVMNAVCINEECEWQTPGPMCVGNGECGMVDGGVLQIICGP